MRNLITGNWTFILGAILWAAVGAVIFWLLFLLPYRRFGNVAFAADAFFEEVSFLFFGCLLGLTIGLATGLSREAAVGAVVPAMLTLIGVLVGYLYSAVVAPRPVIKFTILVSAVALTTFFLWGTFTGAALRAPWDQYSRDFELYKQRYTSDLELVGKKYDAELQRISRIHEAELEVYKATKLKAPKSRPAP